MKFIDFFAGMGTARLGFEQAGYQCVYSVEWDKQKRKIYEVVNGNVPEGSDIKAVRGSDLPRSDCWIAGFPCQDISVAGKQLGFSGERSSLFFEVTRLLQELEEENKHPYLLFENVKNFLSVNNGRDFLEALYQMDSCGYDCEWNLLNSKHFGVPQNRERAFIVGHLRGRSTRKVFPITRTDSKIGADIDILAHRNGYRRNSQVYDINGSIECLDTCAGGGRQPYVAIQINYRKVIEKKDGICSCLDAHYGSGFDNYGHRTGLQVKAVLTPDRAEKRQNGRRIKEDGEPMFTLTKQDRHGVMITDNKHSCESAIKQYQKFIDKNNYIPDLFNPYNCSEIKEHSPTLTGSCDRVNSSSTVLKYDGNRIRRLTPRECFRLQAVPEYIIDKIQDAGISDSQCYRAAGDAMTVTVIYEIAKRMEVK